MKNKILVVVGVLILAAAAFWGGTQYGQRNTASLTAALNSGDRNRGFGARGNFRGNGNDNAAGEIIGKDGASITVKLQAGGSKIIFLSSSTRIMKSMAGTMDDLKIGGQIFANGAGNEDGSLSAQSIQLRSGISN